MSIHCANRVWTYSDQEGSALLLLLALADYADENGFAFPGQETLATKARLCIRQTRRLLADLQAAGELLILDRPGRSNLYVVLAGASRQALAAALERAASFGARTGVLAARVAVPDARVAIPDARVAIPDAPLPTTAAGKPDTDTSPIPDVPAAATVMSTTPDIAMSALPAPTPDISGTTPDISAPTPDIAVSYTPDTAMSSDPSLTKDPSEDPSEDPSGESSWRKILDALSLKMDPATFNLWLRGTRALSLRDGCLTVRAGHANALPWLEHRLSRLIERTLAYYLPGVRLRFVAPGDRHPPIPSGLVSEPLGHVPRAPDHVPEAAGPAPEPRSPTPATVHAPPSTLHRPSSPTGEGSIIVSGEKSVSTLPPLCLCSRQDAPLPLAATGSPARGRPEGWRHRPPRGPPQRRWPGAADLVRQWHVTN